MFKRKYKKELPIQTNLIIIAIGLGLVLFGLILAIIGSLTRCGDTRDSSENERIKNIYTNLVTSLDKKLTDLNIDKILSFSYLSPNIYIQTLNVSSKEVTTTSIFKIEYEEGINSFLSEFGNGELNIEYPIKVVTENKLSGINIEKEESFINKYGTHEYFSSINYVPASLNDEIHFSGIYKENDSIITISNITYSMSNKEILSESSNGMIETKFVIDKENDFLYSFFEYLFCL